MLTVPTRVYLGLGTNLGDQTAQLETAVAAIQKRIGELISLSAFYVTEPWGFTSEHSFLNAVCCVETTLLPFELLVETQTIEQDMGRKHKSVDGVYSDRPIDIDILLYGQEILRTPTLTVPHPLLTERRFVLEPLAEIAPDEVHPVLGHTFREWLDELDRKEKMETL